MTQTQKQQGFTIIEVVLVLAIAGLIFLMVFIALPALQRGQRDTQRRDDASRFISQLNSYATNNNGKVPSFDNLSGTNGFANSYLKSGDGEFQDPKSGNAYKFNKTNADTDTFQYAVNSKCNGEEAESTTGSRSVAVVIKLEGSGSFCADNQ